MGLQSSQVEHAPQDPQDPQDSINVFITVEPPCATTSHKPPPPISDRQSKTPKLSQSKPHSWNL